MLDHYSTSVTFVSRHSMDVEFKFDFYLGVGAERNARIHRPKACATALWRHSAPAGSIEEGIESLGSTTLAVDIQTFGIVLCEIITRKDAQSCNGHCAGPGESSSSR